MIVVVITNFFTNEQVEKLIGIGIQILLALLFLFIGIQVIKIIRKILVKALNKSKADLGAIQFLDSLVKASLYFILIVMIATSFNLLDGSSVIAIIGSAGLAIGLALQNSLSNFVGGILILLLKPFKVGDYIIEDNQKNEGTVIEIELFYTKLATPDSKIIVLPNGLLSNNSLTNVTSTDKRRIDLLVGVSYETDIKIARKVLLNVLEQNENVIQQEEQLIFVQELANSAVVLGVRCWVNTAQYFVTKGQLLEEIKNVLDQNRITIPFPQMNIHFEGHSNETLLKVGEKE